MGARVHDDSEEPGYTNMDRWCTPILSFCEGTLLKVLILLKDVAREKKEREKKKGPARRTRIAEWRLRNGSRLTRTFPRDLPPLTFFGWDEAASWCFILGCVLYGSGMNAWGSSGVSLRMECQDCG